MNKAFLYTLAFWVTWLALAACHEDDLSVPEGGASVETASQTYITLSLSLSRTNRSAGPTGGEDGDGEEKGINKENNIYDLTLFLYSADKGANDNESTPVSFSCYLPDVRFFPREEDDVTCTTLPIPVKAQVDNRTKVIVACNMGDLTLLRTLGSIRDYAVEHVWQSGSAVEACDRFTMASEDEAVIKVRDAAGKLLGQTADRPVEINLGVERTAARIDFCANPVRQDGETPFEYEVRAKAEGPVAGYFYLTHVRPVNVMRQPARMLKATAAEPQASGTLTYYGREQLDPVTGLAANYVIEPTTFMKNERSRTDEALLESWFGETAVEKSKSPDYFTEAYATAGRELHETEEKDGTKVKSYIVGYARENTMAEQYSSAEFVTGLALRGQYLPVTVYRDADGGVDESYRRGQTFWRYLPLRQVTDEENARYFSSSGAAEAYRAAHPEDAAQITEYRDGLCYHYIWIRHAGNDLPRICPMEYGIVRNNIYRIGIGSLTGPGSARPDPRGPDVIRSIIYVKRWNVRQEDDIYM